MLAYFVGVVPTSDQDGCGWTVRVRDLPEVITFVDREGDVEVQAADAIEEAIAGRIADREDIPPPSPGEAGERLVPVPSQTAIKALIWRSLKARGWRRADLARALGWSQSQVDRLLDPRHASRPDRIDTALAALGKRLVVDVRDAA
jgi:antitoxin HicB